MTRTAASAGNLSKWQGCNPPPYLQFYVHLSHSILHQEEGVCTLSVSSVIPTRSLGTTAPLSNDLYHDTTHAVQRQPHIPNPLPPRSCPFTYIKKLHARNAEKRKLTLAILALVTENEVLSKKKEGTPFRALSGTGR